MPPKPQNIGRCPKQPRENVKKDEMKQKKKQHNDMKEIDYICHIYMLLNHHNNTKHEMKQV
ncbi:hypothetical protein AVEN_265992-1, partial [Araneus ventricosus]